MEQRDARRLHQTVVFALLSVVFHTFALYTLTRRSPPSFHLSYIHAARSVPMSLLVRVCFEATEQYSVSRASKISNCDITPIVSNEDNEMLQPFITTPVME